MQFAFLDILCAAAYRIWKFCVSTRRQKGSEDSYKGAMPSSSRSAIQGPVMCQCRNERERSWKTIMIYLNDDFEGGSTNFLNNVAPIRYDDERRIRATPDQIRYQVTPEAGTALVFNHRMLHEGGLVTRGCKYILRSDVMYTRVGGEDMDPKDREALLLFRSAQDAEAEGEMGKAASLYRRAFKMSARLAEAYGNS
eukprot:evm.model.scf_215EXC.10 EVM.evm.TU.scf_215EXC.10   scf_215EXC:113064-113651(-)